MIIVPQADLYKPRIIVRPHQADPIEPNITIGISLLEIDDQSKRKFLFGKGNFQSCEALVKGAMLTKLDFGDGILPFLRYGPASKLIYFCIFLNFNSL